MWRLVKGNIDFWSSLERKSTAKYQVDKCLVFSKDAVEVVFATAFLDSVKALHNMGCMKSKQTFPFPTTLESEKRHESEENFMPEERLLLRMPSLVNVKEEVKEPLGPEIVVFEFAHRLSQEILSDALQQWAGNHLKYYDIPYIESEGPWRCV